VMFSLYIILDEQNSFLFFIVRYTNSTKGQHKEAQNTKMDIRVMDESNSQKRVSSVQFVCTNDVNCVWFVLIMK
jgi:anthranilate/para-aminobenzoate synthase component II